MATSQPTDDSARASGGATDLRIARLSALAELEFAGETSAHNVLNQVTKIATELLPTSLGSSVIVADGDGFRLAATTVAGQIVEAVADRVRDSEGATRHVFETQTELIVPDVADDPFGQSELAAEYGVASYMAVPIVADGRSQGVLFALNAEPTEYGDEDLEFLALLARRSAAALLHAAVFEEMRRARERSEALAWAASAVIGAEDLDEVMSSVVEGVAAAVSADQAALITVHPGRSRVLDYAMSGGEAARPPTYDQVMSGMTGVVIRERRLAISPSVAFPDEQPRIVAPLRKGERILGLLSVERPEQAEPFDSDEVDLVIAMASQAAVAIDNIRLLESTRSSLHETESMYGISQALIESAELPEMLGAVAEGAQSALGGAGALIVTLGDNGDVQSQAAVGTLDEATPEEIAAGPLGRTRTEGVVLGDGESDIFVAAPLTVHDQFLGAIMVVRAGDDPFTDHDAETLLTLTAQAAVAIENHLLFQQVQRLAVTDELTGVHSRRHLFELGEHEFAQAIRYRNPLGAIMFDLDHFKSINDTLGHVVGDEVLRGVADRCREVLREVDVLGRYGGEEFAIILPETDLDGCVAIAERLREQVGDEPIETSRGPVVVTISVGVATVVPGVLDLKTLLDRADVAMYDAKRQGRDRVQTAA